MAILNIIKEGEPSLRKVCRRVEFINPRIIQLLDDMRETLVLAEGVGLAAPQVGVLRRIFIVNTGEKIIELINPEIISTDGTQTGEEGCLSCPGKYGIVTRPNHVIIKATDRDGVEQTYDGVGLIARCFCHENDHLDGKLYIDIADKIINNEDR